MYIDNVSNVNYIYPETKTTAAVKSSETKPVQSMDSLELSPEAARYAEIQAFLKDKPFSAYRYELVQLLEPENADNFIDNLMTNYYEKVPVGEGSPDYDSNEVKDLFALRYGLDTVEKIRESLSVSSFQLNARYTIWGLQGSELFRDQITEDKSIYGNMIMGGELDLYRILDMTVSGSILGRHVSSILNDISFKYSMEVNSDGQLWMIPSNGGKPLTLKEYEEIYSFTTSAIYSAREQGPEATIKYMENYLASLTEEQKQFIKNSGSLSHPAFHSLGIAGMEEFKVYNSYTDVDGFGFNHERPLSTHDYWTICCDIVGGVRYDDMITFGLWKMPWSQQCSARPSLAVKEYAEVPAILIRKDMSWDEKKQAIINIYSETDPFTYNIYKGLLSRNAADADRFIDEYIKRYEQDYLDCYNEKRIFFEVDGKLYNLVDGKLADFYSRLWEVDGKLYDYYGNLWDKERVKFEVIITTTSSGGLISTL